MIEVDPLDLALPLELTVDKLGSGGVTGLVPTVSIRDASTVNRYLDWYDATWKTSSWVTKDAPMTEIGRGHYQRTLDVAALSMTHGFRFAAEYRVTGTSAAGDDSDLFVVTSASANTELLRKALTNRLEETSGNPGELVLYDDDGTTPLKTWELRDEAGAAVLPASGTPARRSSAT